MGTVYLARLRRAHGFARLAAVKSLHPQFAKDEEFRTMLLEEAALTARLRHPNVVSTLDVVSSDRRLLLIMEYFEGVALAELAKRGRTDAKPLPAQVAAAIVGDALRGLHAAHELRDDRGSALGVVHRDVSPQNIHVGIDGAARVLDFGIAKAAGRRRVTQTGEVRGTLGYMSPEHVRGDAVDRRSDVYAAGVVLWELLAGRRFFESKNDVDLARKILTGKSDPPSLFSSEELTEGLDHVVLKAIALDREERWATAEDMARALAEAIAASARDEVAALVKERGKSAIEGAARLARGEGTAELASEPEPRAVADVLTKSLTMGPQGARPRRLRGGVALLGASAVVCAAVTGAVFVHETRSASARATDGDTAPRSLAPTESTPASPVPSAASAAPSPTPQASSTPRASAVLRGTPAHPPAGRRTKPNVDCSVPYTVDTDGVRHYNRECLE
jgi:serine/threonine-protein kinase